MSMGNYPCHADTIEIEFVKEMCPTELDNFLVALDKNNVSREIFAEGFDRDELEGIGDCTEDEAQNVNTSFDKLMRAFREVTGGLELGMVFHTAEDRGDELNGWSFSVDGVYGFTEAGKKYNDKIVRKSWTVFG